MRKIWEILRSRHSDACWSWTNACICLHLKNVNISAIKHQLQMSKRWDVNAKSKIHPKNLKNHTVISVIRYTFYIYRIDIRFTFFVQYRISSRYTLHCEIIRNFVVIRFLGVRYRVFFVVWIFRCPRPKCSYRVVLERTKQVVIGK